MADQEKWKWQEPGTTWKGIGLYHITLTIPDRRPLLGTLEIPDGNPDRAKVRRTVLGNALVDCLIGVPQHHPEVQVLHFCLMPDHLHAVLYVRRTMPVGIRGVVRGFWQGVKKLGRAWSAASSIVPNDIRRNCQEGKQEIVPNDIRRNCQEGKQEILPNDIRRNCQEGRQEIVPNNIRRNCQEGRQEERQEGSHEGSGDIAQQGLREETSRMEAFSAGLQKQIGDDAYYRLSPVFSEMPFIRSMGHNTQLPNTIRYLDMNPQRLATKRLKPGYFRVQREIVIGGRSYDGVGNTMLLTAETYAMVHVRSLMVKAAENGDTEPLRNYKNSCVLAARKGAVMVSPFISEHEKQVMQVLLREQLPFVYLADNGFRDYYKPADALFDACAAGRVLILSPWTYDAGKRKISRADCMALNNMAEEICNHLFAL